MDINTILNKCWNWLYFFETRIYEKTFPQILMEIAFVSPCNVFIRNLFEIG